MLRKKIIRWVAGAVLLILLACTVISNAVYEASLPRVRTRVVEKEIGELLDGYGLWETMAWIPRECVFPSSDGNENKACVYRIRQRAGQFSSTEYYLEAVELPIEEEREDAVRLDDLLFAYSETLVCETNVPLKDGQVVVWLNLEK